LKHLKELSYFKLILLRKHIVIREKTVLTDKTILITGGTGSFGNFFCGYHPKNGIILDMTLKNKTGSVTGADGFIGSHLTEALVKEGALVGLGKMAVNDGKREV
jgi:FlaA1/EpsC-like NDP-sugar epimerase